MEKKINTEKLLNVLGFEPHEKQRQIIESNARTKIICAGRRGGKTMTAGFEATKMLLQQNKRVWAVAPDFSLTLIVFDEVIKNLAKVLGTSGFSYTKRPHPVITIPSTGSLMEGKSVENPRGMLGRSTDLIVMDEAATVDREIWKQYLEPTTIERKGKTIMISTPRGMNWFYDLWLWAQGEDARNADAFHFTSLERPGFPRDEWDRLKRETPEKVFQQEYEAQFISEAGTVFRNLENVIGDDTQPPKEGRSYVLGVDLAKSEDFTVLVVMDRASREMVYMDRFQDLSYNIQKERIVALSKKYNNAKVIIDSSGCLVDNQRIITENGFKALKDIRDGEKAITGKGNYKSVSKIHTSGKKNIDVYKITPSYQTIPTELSFSHQVYTIDGWTDVGDLEEGDYLKIPIRLPRGKFDYSCFKNHNLYHPKAGQFKNKKFYKTLDFWRTVGYFIAEGYTRTNRGINGKKYNQISFAFNIKENEYHNDIERFASIIGRTANKRTREKFGCVELTISCGWLSEWFNIFGKKAHLKKIPAEFDYLPDKYKKEIIKGFWRGDGDIMKDKKGFRLHSSSIDLILTMQRWLLHFGIISSLTVSKRKPRDKYVLNIYGNEGVKFGEIIGEQHYKIKKINPTVGYIENGYFYSPIKIIEIEEREAVLWEFEVEDDNSALGNGLVMHNKGDPIAEDISRQIFTESYSMHSMKAKEQLIEKLILYIEQEHIKILPNEILLNELRRYGYEMSSQGKKYHAPKGSHDDTVIALALAVWSLQPKAIEDDKPKIIKRFNTYV